MTTEERLLSKRLITSEGCWRFTGATTIFGYGMMNVDGKLMRVNRLSASIYLGLDLTNRSQQACHKDDICKYRDCFNPEHLYVGTNKTNMEDAIKRGTHGKTRHTHCPNGHEFTVENTYTAEGCRRCKICDPFKIRGPIRNLLEAFQGGVSRQWQNNTR